MKKLPIFSSTTFFPKAYLQLTFQGNSVKVEYFQERASRMTTTLWTGAPRTTHPRPTRRSLRNLRNIHSGMMCQWYAQYPRLLAQDMPSQRNKQSITVNHNPQLYYLHNKGQTNQGKDWQFYHFGIILFCIDRIPLIFSGKIWYIHNNFHFFNILLESWECWFS